MFFETTPFETTPYASPKSRRRSHPLELNTLIMAIRANTRKQQTDTRTRNIANMFGGLILMNTVVMAMEMQYDGLEVGWETLLAFGRLTLMCVYTTLYDIM